MAHLLPHSRAACASISTSIFSKGHGLNNVNYLIIAFVNTIQTVITTLPISSIFVFYLYRGSSVKEGVNMYQYLELFNGLDIVSSIYYSKFIIKNTDSLTFHTTMHYGVICT